MKLQKLTENYNPKKKKNYNDSDIEKKLKGYKKLNDFDDICINSHIRYFKIENGIKYFRSGGFLKQKHNNYIMLSNGKFIWSVQLDETNEFYIKIKVSDLIESYENKIKVLIDFYENKIKNLTN